MNPLLLVIVTVIVFVGVLMTGSFLYWSLRTRDRTRQREVARRLGTVTENAEERLFRLTQGDPMARSMGSIGRDLEALVKQAGSPYPLRGLFLRMGIWATGGCLVLGLLLKGPVAVIGVMLGTIPVLILNSKAEERARDLSEQLPDGLDLIGRSLQAGHGLSDAMRLCAEEMGMPIAHEFGRVYEEHNLGRDLRDALNNLAERNPRNFDLKIFVSSVLLQRDTGGNLIEILENISGTIRSRFVFKGKVRSLTAEARFSAYILGGLPFVVALLIFVMRPEYLLPLINDPLGHIISGGALFLFFMGVIIMKNISTVDV